MNPIVRPNKPLSFEDALRNLASRLTGTPVAELPRTQEAIVQYMAENVKLPEAPAQEPPGVDIDKLREAVMQEVMARIDMDALGEAVTQEVMARMAETVGANLAATEPAEAAQDGADNAGGTSLPLPPLKRPQRPPKRPQSPPSPRPPARPPRRKPKNYRKDD